MKIISWNVNGIRAAAKKDFQGSVHGINPDILCLQETKAQDGQVAEAIDLKEDYNLSINSAMKKGYSGTAILSKENPISVKNHLGIKAHDQEGRVMTAEYEHFFLVNVYVPNSKRGLLRLDYREGWDKDLLAHLKNLEKKKPVIICGDLNVAHQAIDLKNPKSNYNKTAGYTQVEIDGLSNYIDAGFIDSFRHFHPEQVAYSWWSYRMKARERNIGWRIDYFLVSKSIIDKVTAAFILPEVIGSDHCPVGIEIDF